MIKGNHTQTLYCLVQTKLDNKIVQRDLWNFDHAKSNQIYDSLKNIERKLCSAHLIQSKLGDLREKSDELWELRHLNDKEKICHEDEENSEIEHRGNLISFK